MIEVNWHDRVAEIALARPPVNALDPELVQRLRGTLAACVDDGAGALVLAGSPGLFSAGLDVPALLQLDRHRLRGFWSEFFALLEDLARSQVPVAAALTGHSPAGGTVIALYCDHRVMARGEFGVGLNEVAVGLVVPGVIRKALARLLGTHGAERHLLTAELIGPDTALDVGLVDELAEPGNTVTAAVDWCRGRLQLPAAALHETRRALRHDLADLFADPGNLDLDAFCDHWFRDDTQAVLEHLVASLGQRR